MKGRIAGPEIERLIQSAGARLPGLGPRSARKAALALLKRRNDLLEPLAAAMAEAAAQSRRLRGVRQLDTVHRARSAPDQRRDRSLIVVVEEIGDLWALERAGVVNGVYHVLGGHLSPLDGIGPEQLNIARLVERARAPEVRRGAAGAQRHGRGPVDRALRARAAGRSGVKVSRLAHGVPVGGELDYLDEGHAVRRHPRAAHVVKVAVDMPNDRAARFVTGSIPAHILRMTDCRAVGLMAIFVGELANILFLEHARRRRYRGRRRLRLDGAVPAAVGWHRHRDRGERADRAGHRRRRSRLRQAPERQHSRVAVGFAAVAGTVVWTFVPNLIALLGATGRTHALATGYLRILIPFMTLMSLGMCASAVLRSQGDARRSMNVTLVGAFVNVALDPLFIFVFGLGIDGAAWATNISRVAVAGSGLYWLIRVHDLITWPRLADVIADSRTILRFAIPRPSPTSRRPSPTPTSPIRSRRTATAPSLRGR